MNRSFIEIDISDSAYNLIGIEFNIYIPKNVVYSRQIITVPYFIEVCSDDLSYDFV
jgi:hypothetical protein